LTTGLERRTSPSVGFLGCGCSTGCETRELEFAFFAVAMGELSKWSRPRSEFEDEEVAEGSIGAGASDFTVADDAGATDSVAGLSADGEGCAASDEVTTGLDDDEAEVSRLPG